MAELSASFALFPAKEKSQERSPDYTGTIAIPVDQINALISHLGAEPEDGYGEQGKVIKLRIAGWKASSANVPSYINGKVSLPRPAQPQQTSVGMPF